MTPTIHREGPYRFFFYSHEPREPPHVHIERDDAIAKIWLHDGSIADSGGLPPRDLQRIVAMVTVHRDSFFEVDPDEGGPPGRFAPSASPLVLPHAVSGLSPDTASGMSTLANPEPPRASHLWFERGRLVVQFQDGRELACPLAFFPRLAEASVEDLSDWRLTGRGTGIHWPRLDEDLSVQGLLEGRRAPEAGAQAKALAPRLRAARRQAGLTQVQLAERMGRSQALVSLAERGALRIGTPYLNAVLEACGLPMDWQP